MGLSRLIVRLVTGMTLAALPALAPAAARAAFPGGNGLLAVQPHGGSGIELVAPGGGVRGRICTSVGRCGIARRPRFSPDGRALVFAGSSGLRAVYLDGSCLDCRFGRAANAAFEPDGTLVSFIGGRTLRADGIDGVRKADALATGVSDAVWAADGRLAVVRSGWIWAGRPGRLRRLARGEDPSWAPGGARLAAADRGWVVIVSLGGRERRLVRGNAPAFSPDGRRVAYVGANHRLMVMGVTGGPVRPHPVGRISAVSVDWQPVVNHPPACAVPPESRVMASSPAAVVTVDGVLPPLDFDSLPGPAYMGCLRADGRERLLERFAGENVDGASVFDAATVAAPFAAFIEHDFDEHYGGDSWTVVVFDLRTGQRVPRLGGERTGCSSGPCPVLDDLVLGSDGVSAARSRAFYPEGYLSVPLQGVSCAPDGSRCVAVDVSGRVFTSGQPLGGSWTAAATPVEVGGNEPIDCPSGELCVLGGGAFIATTSAPTGSTSAWTSTRLPAQTSLWALTCPSTTLCVGTSLNGQIVSSTDPAGGASAWSVADIDGARALDSVFCAGTSPCFATDSGGAVFASTDPAGGAGAWHRSTSTPPFTRASCPTATFCVMLGSRDREIRATADPAAGPWTAVGAGSNLDAVSCPTTSFCAAVGYNGELDVSTDPAAGPWQATQIDGGQTLASIDCPSTSLCVATDDRGHAVTSTDPTGGPSAWTPELIDGSWCTATTDCSVEQIVASAGHGVQTLDSAMHTGDGPTLTDLALTGDTLSWRHAGSSRSATLSP